MQSHRHPPVLSIAYLQLRYETLVCKVRLWWGETVSENRWVSLDSCNLCWRDFKVVVTIQVNEFAKILQIPFLRYPISLILIRIQSISFWLERKKFAKGMWVTRCPYGAMRASHIACVYGDISVYQSIYLDICIYFCIDTHTCICYITLSCIA